MPTYQYACTDCGHDFEAVQSFSDDSLTTCPQCSGRLRKLFGNVGVVFKGSGFYRNDSRSSGSTTSDSTKSDSTKSDSAKSDATKSDATKSGTTKSDTSTSSSSKTAPAATSSSA